MFLTGLAILFTLTLVAPAIFFIAPQRVQAQAGAIGCVSGVAAGLASLVIEAVKNVPATSPAGEAGSITTAGATLGSCVDDTILKPFARLMARIVLQQITTSTINWITGKNGNGQPSFVVNLSLNLQSVGDAVALPFINQIRTGFNSPFGSAISSALQVNYNQKTSLAGFFSANQSTLPGSLQSQQAFLAGNWSQGGIPAWFALTTQCQNNPYCLYQTSESQLGSNVSQAQTNRRQDLIQSQGFLSWCGTTAAAAQTQSQASGGYQACIDQCNNASGGYTASCADSCATNFSQSGGSIGGATSNGINPGASCTNSDGTPGNIQTPGSVIHDYTQKAVVGAGIDQLVSAQDLDQALGAIALALVNQVLSGSGLLGASAPSSSSRPSAMTLLQSYAASNAAAATSATSLAQMTLAQLGTYTGAWNTITAAANTAKTSVDALVTYCNAQAKAPYASPSVITAQVNAAQTALATLIAPILAQAQAALSSAAITQTLALKVQSEAAAMTSVTSATTGAAGALTADTQALTAAPPSTANVVNAQADATATGAAVALPRPVYPNTTPTVSLTVSGGTLVDRMSLISTNATKLQATCTPVAPVVTY
jgi:hypothetical protein